MESVTEELAQAGRIDPPAWLPHRVAFEALTGSFAYGCAEEGSSDLDLMGFYVPPVEVLFPHLDGHVPGFSDPPDPFEQFQEHCVVGEDGLEYDLTLHSLPKFLRLCLNNNPNLIDVLYVPDRCILYRDAIGRHVHDHRRLFLSKQVYRTFRGYSFSQLNKLKEGVSKQHPKRKALVDAHGFDTKFAYHIIRILLECEQILTTGDLVLDRDADLYRAVRAGEWSVAQVMGFTVGKAAGLEDALAHCTLAQKPDPERIRSLLLECLEMQYGSLAEATRMRRPGALFGSRQLAAAEPGSTAVLPEA